MEQEDYVKVEMRMGITMGFAAHPSGAALRAGRAASGVYEIFMQLIIAEALRNMN